MWGVICTMPDVGETKKIKCLFKDPTFADWKGHLKGFCLQPTIQHLGPLSLSPQKSTTAQPL